MEKFKLLIIGDANHQYIHNFSKWIRTVIPNISITIVSFHSIKNTSTAELYFENYFEVPPNSKIISKIVGFRAIYLAYKLYRLMKNNNLTADTILVHYVQSPLALIGYFLKKRTANYVMAIWGSDFYRVSSKKLLGINIKYADNIIIGSPEMIMDFERAFENEMNKVHLCYFGSEPIENIKKLKDSNMNKIESCMYFGFNADKINITLGHNGSKAHQHVLILNELNKLGPNVVDKIRVILPMTYGLDRNYLNEIINVCRDCPFEYKIFTDYMNDNEVAHLRNLTDIMINMQKTDALSGSMREVIFNGGVVVNGSWLPYQFLKDLGVYYEEAESIQQISNKISEIVLNYSFHKDKCKENSSKIFKISSWSETIYKWKEVILLKR